MKDRRHRVVESDDLSLPDATLVVLVDTVYSYGTNDCSDDFADRASTDLVLHGCVPDELANNVDSAATLLSFSCTDSD